MTLLSRNTLLPAAAATLFALAAQPVSVSAQTADAPSTQAPTTAPADAPAIDPLSGMVGKPAPAFSLPDQNDKNISLSSAKGKWVVLAFYPADMTTGCTFQNRSYTKSLDKFTPLNAVVYTVSTQDTASKRAFCSKEGLTHTLLSDVGGKVAGDYGILRGKVARRVTFYIAPDGSIADVDTKIDVQNAAEESIGILERLAKQQPAATSNLEVRNAAGGNVATTVPSDRAFVGAAAIKVTMGSAIPDFGLTNVATGKTAAYTTLSAGKKATVLVFISTQCPVSNDYNERMAQLASSYAARGVQFVGINANSTEETSAIAAHARQNDFSFPVLKDEGNKVADQFQAQVTPEVFLVNEKGVLVYHGPIDDNRDASQAKEKYLTNAIDALLAGKTVPAAGKKAFGCAIKRAP